MVQAKRHLLKTISYRILSSSIGFVVVYTATNSWKFGAAFTTSELVFKPFLYFAHERVWYKWIKFGLDNNNNNIINQKNKTNGL